MGSSFSEIAADLACSSLAAPLAMNPQLKNFLIVLAACLVAMFLGWKLAEGEHLWPALATLVAGVAAINRLTGLSGDVVFLGVVVAGYIVGNRGFAQLPVLGSFPLLPAEAALLVAGAWRAVVCAFERRLPVRRDGLNRLVLLWMVVGTARVLFDLPEYRFLAVRDYAMVYYAAFFFIAQQMAEDAKARRYLIGALVVALALLVPIGPAYEAFPGVFWSLVSVGGAPLIYFKGDLLNTFLGVAALLVFVATPRAGRKFVLPVTAAVFAYVLFGNNRASALALLAAAGLFAAARRWQFPVWHFGAAALAGVLVIGAALFTDNDWAQRKLAGVGDRVASVIDPGGVRAYRSEESGNKGDNNRFRLVWWQTVARETVAANPVFGLGFGYDLAGGFVREYAPDLADEFSTRSPHNMFMTAFGRMGLVGATIWAGIFLLIIGRTLRALRADDEMRAALWTAATMILVSSLFGVVLEGPMGAVPFWVLLGLASNEPEPETPETASGKP